MSNTKINLNVLKSAKRRNYVFVETTSLVDNVYMKNIREKLGLSQTAMAHVLGCSKKAIEKWEQGKNPIKGSTSRLLYLINDDSRIIDKFITVSIDKKHEQEVKSIDEQFESNKDYNMEMHRTISTKTNLNCLFA